MRKMIHETFNPGKKPCASPPISFQVTLKLIPFSKLPDPFMTLYICTFSLLPGVPSVLLSATLSSIHLGDCWWESGRAHYHLCDTFLFPKGLMLLLLLPGHFNYISITEVAQTVTCGPDSTHLCFCK